MEESKPRKKIYSDAEALKKAEHYCAYQERSQQEVRDKLYEWGAYPNVIEQTISKLIDGNFLNEERFAKAYVHGKLHIKHWGRIKIKQGLKLKRVSEPLIKKALLSIDLDEYEKILRNLLEKKKRSINEKEGYKLNYKLIQYAQSRGFESDLVRQVLQSR
ncbi:regulatory protein RecX [Mucilaginibacter ginkgonis]|uniref:Regulatory protein RecX n=1 Tax=Mucilaginibacter ginkgonis TaxID=2682091 RepID=A0A6I4HX74_9SPHI|nr:regulatory protein RecX [Mucilaginibacter ginkgonis]QQL50950.1 RecX family transcriptional regulator [Mucilaginibacter ginkgonis]